NSRRETSDGESQSRHMRISDMARSLLGVCGWKQLGVGRGDHTTALDPMARRVANFMVDTPLGSNRPGTRLTAPAKERRSLSLDNTLNRRAGTARTNLAGPIVDPVMILI